MGVISMKLGVVLVFLLTVLCGCQDVQEGKESKESRSFIERSNNESVEVLVDGKEVTEERRALEEKFRQLICEYLQCEREDVEFDMIIALGTEMLTVDVKFEECWYTVTGDIIDEEVSIKFFQLIEKDDIMVSK